MNQGVEWAAHCAALLAALPPDVAVPAAKLAEFHDLPAPYLAKALQQLAAAGIVSAVPGRRGGYRLARPAAEITLRDIVDAVDGGAPAFSCTEIRRRGPSAVARRFYSPRCGIAAAMWDAEQAFRDSLAAVTIASIAEGVLRDSPPAALEKGARWLAAALGPDAR
ncbi:MAG: RrF2 family transcriptional regulator [Nocardioidaceae bacterium]